MNISGFDHVFDAALDDLTSQGWALCDDFLPQQLVRELAEQCKQRQAQGLLTRAGVGRGKQPAVAQTLRGDSIQWLEAGMATSLDAYLAAMDALREALNRSLYLGLVDYECHFALYPPGAFYKQHVDRFRDDDRREISAVFYLNQNWGADDGGALRLFLPERPGQPHLDVQPVAGRLVLFRSAQLVHEVLPAGRERLSLAGWFRRRGEGVL